MNIHTCDSIIVIFNEKVYISHLSFNMFTEIREMGNIEEVLRIRKVLESLIETPENIPAEAPVHIDELVNIYLVFKAAL